MNFNGNGLIMQPRERQTFRCFYDCKLDEQHDFPRVALFAPCSMTRHATRAKPRGLFIRSPLVTARLETSLIESNSDRYQSDQSRSEQILIYFAFSFQIVLLAWPHHVYSILVYRDLVTQTVSRSGKPETRGRYLR